MKRYYVHRTPDIGRGYRFIPGRIKNRFRNFDLFLLGRRKQELKRETGTEEGGGKGEGQNKAQKKK